MWRQRTAGRDDDVRRAWWSFALFVPALVLAFLVGGGLLAALGYSEAAAPPAGIALAAGTPALLVFASPTLVVWRYGRRAQQRGHPEGRLPVLVAVAVSGAFVSLNLLQLLARVVLER